jgi:MFS family permease
MTPRFATFLLFLVNGTIVGTWVASIPAIQVRHEASGTLIGLILLAAALGALLAMPITGQILTRVSSRRVLIATTVPFTLLAAVPLVAPTPLLLAVGLFFWGAANGSMDVAMNAHGIAIERSLRRPILSSLHAGWSAGGILGAAGVAAAVAFGADAALEALLMGVLMLLLALVAVRYLGSGTVATESSARISLPSRAVLPIGLLAVAVAFVEGGLADWAGIFLRADVGTDAAVAALGYGSFALGMTVSRFAGDRVRERVGAIPIVRWGLALVAIMVAALLVAGSAAVAFLGLFLAGIGLANAIPLFFNAAGQVPPSGPSLSAVFTLTYSAFLIGPPVIGVASDALGVTMALGLLVVVSIAVVVAVGRVPGVEIDPHFGAAPDIGVGEGGSGSVNG